MLENQKELQLKEEKNLYIVLRNLSLITQVGLNMVTPLFLCLFIGLWVDRRFQTRYILLFILLGLASGILSTYKMLKKILEKDARRMEAEKAAQEQSSTAKQVSAPKPKSRVFREDSKEDMDG